MIFRRLIHAVPLLVLAASARLPAAEDPRRIPLDPEEIRRCLDLNQALSTLNPGSANPGCRPDPASSARTPKPTSHPPEGNPSSLAACPGMMEKLYADGLADIRLFFGYGDDRPDDEVTDQLERSSVIDGLAAPCDSKSIPGACGFKQSPDDADRFVKTLGSGPQARTIQIVIRSASLSASDKHNRANPKQKEQSRKLQAQFEEACGTAEVVFYAGHSRSGGGPDFAPPVLRPNKHVNYSWYKTHRPGLTRLLRALSGTKDSKLLLYGSFSCSSSLHFRRKIAAVAPQVSYIGSTRAITIDEEIQSLLVSIGRLAEKKCDFNQRFKGLDLPMSLTNGRSPKP